jgi:hypothetical protein
MVGVSHLLPSGKSSDSTDARSTATHTSHASSAPTLSTEIGGAATNTRPANSMDERDGAANALLGLFSSAATATSTNNNNNMEEDGASGSDSAALRRTSSSPSVPFKKRLIMDAEAEAEAQGSTNNNNNKKQIATTDACHISPVSHSSSSDHTASRTESKDTPPRKYATTAGGVTTTATTTATTANRSASYDSTTGKDSNASSVIVTTNQRTQALLAESKVHNASQIGLMTAQQLAKATAGSGAAFTTAGTTSRAATGATVAAMAAVTSTPPRMVPHFPTVLHHVLAEPHLTTAPNAVLQWLPDGESFQIKNWTSLRRQVLPKYFSDLRDENGTVASAGTIDAFLYHLGAWGFEEIKDVNDNTNSTNGAYKHEVRTPMRHEKELYPTCSKGYSLLQLNCDSHAHSLSPVPCNHQLFIRGAQKLCVRMRFTADQMDGHKGPKTVSPTRPSLQVPTLASQDCQTDMTSSTSGAASMLPNKRPRYDGTVAGAMHWPYSSATEPWGSLHRHVLPPQHYHSPEHLYGMRVGVNAGAAGAMVGPYGLTPVGSSYPPELQYRRHSMDSIVTSQQPPAAAPGVAPRQYSPPQVRSARGGLRLAANRAAATGSPSASALSIIRQNFPVSNRGKGPRKPASVRNTVATAKSDESKDDIKASATSSCSDRSGSPKTSAQSSTTTTLSEAQRIGQGVVDAVARKTSGGTKRKLPMAAASSACLATAEKPADVNKEESKDKEVAGNPPKQCEEEKKED